MFEPPQETARSWLNPDHRVKVEALYALMAKPKRFSEVLRVIDVANDNQLTQALKALQDKGLVMRLAVATGPQGIVYEATELGVQVWSEWYLLDRIINFGIARALNLSSPPSASTAAPEALQVSKKKTTNETISQPTVPQVHA